ncbi:ComEC family competence protein [Haematospirillum sp. H1815]|uniref:ComEC/Rec2 family competence protein n=1 Tax=Haematospirillum sp. H1815 TaxID=2723108 RepID=UPI00143AD814|nr:ComEC/Rec2 family competence protein [Haematospirillum sp. H1815]NKD76546.1 ComEC family competence protein [Haematospirillum sp. H1815]
MYARTWLSATVFLRLFLRISHVFDQIRWKMVAEQDWGLPWGAVFLASGAGVYFSLHIEPSIYLISALVFIAFVSACVLAWSVYVRRGFWMGCAIASLAFLAGFMCAQQSAVSVSAPVLMREVPPVILEGVVVRIEPLPVGSRILLEHIVIMGFKPEDTPNRVRLVMRRDFHALPGQRIRLRAGLLPPSPPSAPGSYDFQRIAWFEKIGAVGYGVSTPEFIGEDPSDSVWAFTEVMRQHIGQRLRAGIPGDGGAVAAALVTGERQAISPATIDAYRDAGLSHLLAISGLNIGIYAGIIFVVVRGGLAMVPAVALRWDIKKLAAVLALLATTVYLLISGSGIPAVRSWIMSGVVLCAIVLDRKALSFRVLAVAALLIVLFRPDSILGPTFQMSFAAVLALISGYMILQPRLTNWRARSGGPVSAAWRSGAVYVFGIVSSTLLATVATAPYAIYHFHRLPLYGLLANLVAVPVTAVWIMPWLALALVLMPFDMEALALMPLAWGVDLVRELAILISALPHASLHIPPMTLTALVLATLSGFWLCVWQGAWRWWGVPVLLVSLMSPWVWRDIPQLVVSGDARVIAVSDGEGLILLPGRSGRFTRSTWLERWGQSSESWDRWSTGERPWRCDPYGCLYRHGGYRLALAYREEAILEDCSQVDVIITPLKVSSNSPLRSRCNANRFIDGWTLERAGTHVFYFDNTGIQVRTVVDDQGQRLWSHSQRPALQAKEDETEASVPMVDVF